MTKTTDMTAANERRVEALRQIGASASEAVESFGEAMRRAMPEMARHDAATKRLRA